MTCPVCENAVPENDDRFLPYCSEDCQAEGRAALGQVLIVDEKVLLEPGQPAPAWAATSAPTTKPRGITISGKQGSGKTTLIKALQAALNRAGHDHHTISFAEPVKSLSKAVLVEVGLVEPGAAEADWKYKHRGVPQVVGEHLRGYDPFIWVSLAAARIKALPATTIVLNDDCRHINEVKALKDAGLFAVRIEASRGLRLRRLGELRNEQHISETALDNFDGWDLVIMQDEFHDVALPEEYAQEILRQAGLQVARTRQAVIG